MRNSTIPNWHNTCGAFLWSIEQSWSMVYGLPREDEVKHQTSQLPWPLIQNERLTDDPSCLLTLAQLHHMSADGFLHLLRYGSLSISQIFRRGRLSVLLYCSQNWFSERWPSLWVYLLRVPLARHYCCPCQSDVIHSVRSESEDQTEVVCVLVVTNVTTYKAFRPISYVNSEKTQEEGNK